MMKHRRACVVTLRLNKDRVDGTGCGIVIDTKSGYVISHGSLLAPLIQKDWVLTNHLQADHVGNLSASQLTQIKAEVLLERPQVSDDIFDEDISLLKYQTALVNSAAVDKNPSIISHPADVLSIFRCLKFENAIRKLMPTENWKFIDDTLNKNDPGAKVSKVADENSDEDSTLFKLLPCFLLLKLHNWIPYNSCMHIRDSSTCRIGEPAEILSTPFGNLFPNVLLNSWSRGIISNLAGKNQCLILTDARCIPGSEGGPLYTVPDHRSSRCLTGLIVASMCWKNSEWIGLSMACSIEEVLGSLPLSTINISESKKMRPIWSISNPAASLASMFDSVPFLKVGNTWGSGVIVSQNPGIIVTCSHVIKGAHQHKVKIKQRPHHYFHQCDVIQSSPLAKQFDLAVLLCCGTLTLSQSKFKPSAAKEGSLVYVIGHATFGEEHDLQPTVTSGIVSKILKVNNVPIMIQTTCAVHPGASGGALVDSSGNLVGIVVCNAKDTESGACFPHVNMSIPVSTVWPVIEKYRRTKDVEVLRDLYLKSAAIDSMWMLGPPPVSSGTDMVTRSKL